MTKSIQTLMIAELPSLKAYATALTANHAAAGELVEKTVALALDRMAEAASAPSLRAWLCAQARQAFRPTIGRSPHLDPRLTRRIATRADTGAQRTVMTATLGALFALPILDREAVMLVDVLGLSGAEAALVARCTEQAVAARQARARVALRLRLAGNIQHGTMHGRTGRPESRAAA